MCIIGIILVFLAALGAIIFVVLPSYLISKYMSSPFLDPIHRDYMYHDLNQQIDTLRHLNWDNFRSWYNRLEAHPDFNGAPSITSITTIPPQTILTQPDITFNDIDHLKFMHTVHYYRLLLQWCHIYNTKTRLSGENSQS